VITEKQRQARESFDLDAAMAALPPASARPASDKGGAGVRLRAHLVADISDDLLREFAKESLKAERCSEQYLDALRVVLGNQADAEQNGYVLEMNQRVSFAPQRVMRTIINQMQAAGISFGSVVVLGDGRSQVVQCFGSDSHGQRMNIEGMTNAEASDELERRNRQQEAAEDIRREAVFALEEFPRAVAGRPDPYLLISAADVPY
jgi:hypothetical protein